MITLNSNEIQRWFADKGDYTHNLDYDLNEDSVVMDLGGYTGVWAQQIIERYNPNIYIIEPIPKLHEFMSGRFEFNSKVNLMNVGVSTENKKGKIFLNGDGSSTIPTGGDFVDVDFLTIDEVLNKWKLTSVDLLQINIEGDEYPLLEYMIKEGLLRQFKNIQVQFHLGIEDCENRRQKIREGFLDNGFEINFDYPFVWESWKQI